MRTALIAHAGRRLLEDDVSGVRGWVVMGTSANAEPWGHLDLDGLRRFIGSGAG